MRLYLDDDLAWPVLLPSSVAPGIKSPCHRMSA